MEYEAASLVLFMSFLWKPMKKRSTWVWTSLLSRFPALLSCRISIHLFFKISVKFHFFSYYLLWKPSLLLTLCQSWNRFCFSSWMSLSASGILFTWLPVTLALWWTRTIDFENHPALCHVYRGSNIFFCNFPSSAESKLPV